MSTPSTPAGSPPGRTALSGRWLAAIAVCSLLGAFVCSGTLVGLAYLALHKTNSAIASGALRGTGLPIAPTSPPAINTWWIDRVLSEVYTAAVDAVVTDEQVLELLGDPVSSDFESDSLYDRERSGELSPRETITFHIVGPKGKAAVTVVAVGADAPHWGTAASNLRIKSIEVRHSDGTVIDVPPPTMEPLSVR
jgi:hypothetical protein